METSYVVGLAQKREMEGHTRTPDKKKRDVCVKQTATSAVVAAHHRRRLQLLRP